MSRRFSLGDFNSVRNWSLACHVSFETWSMAIQSGMSMLFVFILERLCLVFLPLSGSRLSVKTSHLSSAPGMSGPNLPPRSRALSTAESHSMSWVGLN